MFEHKKTNTKQILYQMCINQERVLPLIEQSALPIVYAFNEIIIHINKHNRITITEFYLFQSSDLGLGLDVIFAFVATKVQCSRFLIPQTAHSCSLITGCIFHTILASTIQK